MQLQELLSAAQNGTLRVAKLFFKENPDLMDKYVNTGVTAIGLVLNPLNVFMKHLIIVQGIDPNSTPGEKNRKAFLDSLTDSLPEHHARDFDDDYEFGAFHQSLLKTRDKLSQLTLTKDKFRAFTNLANMPGGFENVTEDIEDVEEAFFGRQLELNRVAPELPKKELPLDKESRQTRREKVLKEVADMIRNEYKATTFDPIADLKSALTVIKEAATKLEDENHKSFAKQENKKPLKIAKKSLNKRPTKVVSVTERFIEGKDFGGSFSRASSVKKDT